MWVRDGRILDPEKLFFDEQGYADRQLDCGGDILAPGFIDVQINGSRAWACEELAAELCVCEINICVCLSE